MIKKTIFIILFPILLFSQQQTDIPWPTLANSPWPMIKHDPQATGRSPISGPKTPRIQWTLDLPFGVYSGPITGEDGTLYVGTNSFLGFIGDTTNYFYAINPVNGKIKWTFFTGNPMSNESGYLINNEGTIFFGSQSGWLYAIDTTGNLKWKYNTGGNIHQEIMNTDHEGNIYIANSTNYLFCFSKSGELKWKVSYGTGLFPKSVSFLPDGNSMYVMSGDNSLYVLNLDGSIKRVIVFPYNVIHRAPVLTDNDGNFYIISRYDTTGQGCVMSFDSTGNRRWLYLLNSTQPGLTNSSPAMDYEGNIYFTYYFRGAGSDYSRVESLDYFGNLRWTYEFEQPNEQIEAPLIVDSDQTVYCGSTWGYYYYAISKSGELLWKIPLNGYEVDNSGAIGSDGTLYLGLHLNSTNTIQEKTLIAIRDSGLVSVRDNHGELGEYSINQNFPNPFNPETVISYQLPKSGLVTLRIYDILGKEVASLVNQEQSAGRHEVSFDAGHLSSGVYICRIIAGDFVKTIKMSLVK